MRTSLSHQRPAAAHPALRERPDDIPPLVEHLLARIARHRKTKPCHIAPAALRRLLSHPGPATSAN
ncbi:hypothetical protein HS125_13715 [bacterium]|nr:hypothetical protein [bacterium]